MVLPGFVETEGFPATELRAKALTRWIVSKPEKVAEAIYEVGPGGKAERYVPRPYALAAVARILFPRLVRRVLAGGSAADLTTSTGGEQRAGLDDRFHDRARADAAWMRRQPRPGTDYVAECQRSDEGLGFRANRRASLAINTAVPDDSPTPVNDPWGGLRNAAAQVSRSIGSVQFQARKRAAVRCSPPRAGRRRVRGTTGEGRLEWWDVGDGRRWKRASAATRLHGGIKRCAEDRPRR